MQSTSLEHELANKDIKSLPLFCYGTLIIPEVRTLILGEVIAERLVAHAAILEAAQLWRVKGELYPAITRSNDPQDVVSGQLLTLANETSFDWGDVYQQLDAYEGPAYDRHVVKVRLVHTGEEEGAQPAWRQAWCYFAGVELRSSLHSGEWSPRLAEHEVSQLGGWKTWLGLSR